VAKGFQTVVKAMRQRLPLRWVLVVPFVLQLAFTIGLTGYLSLQNGQKAVNDLVNQLNEEVSDRVLQHLDNFTSDFRRVALISSREIKTGRISPAEPPSFLSFFWQQAETYDIGFLLYGDREGKLLGAGNHFNDDTVSVVELDPKKYRNQDLYVYRADRESAVPD
jgi:hypothetical protein